MPALLLGFLMRPVVMVGIVAAALTGALWIQSNRNEKERLKAEAAISELRAQIGTLTASGEKMAGEIQNQNHEIDRIEAKAKQIATNASLAAIRQIQQGQAAADALRAPTSTVPPGANEMNAWLRERLVTP